MPLLRLLQESNFDVAFGPDVIEAMAAAFEEACSTLGLAAVTDPLRLLVAEKIIDCAKTGEHDRARLRDCALKAIRG